MCNYSPVEIKETRKMRYKVTYKLRRATKPVSLVVNASSFQEMRDKVEKTGKVSFNDFESLAWTRELA